ncbi:MAG: hypothetical protein LAT65_17875 [Saccharospirillum sp.]|nr:hypothetical protein [Saccharospirillum sp.]
MAAIILGKTLLTDEELIEHAFSVDNEADLNLTELRHHAVEAAMYTSMLLIRMMKAERIYVECRPTITPDKPL